MSEQSIEQEVMARLARIPDMAEAARVEAAEAVVAFEEREQAVAVNAVEAPVEHPEPPTISHAEQAARVALDAHDAMITARILASREAGTV